MSTKIYEAYKVQGLTIEEVMECLKKLREHHFDLIHEHLMKFDFEKIKEEYGGFNGFVDALRADADKLQMSLFNWTSDVAVYFHENEIYLQFFGIEFKVDLDSMFNNCLVDYHYQNQSDPWFAFDESLTEEEIEEAEKDYERREEVWNDIFGESYTPAQVGLIYHVYQSSDSFMVGFRYWQENTKKEE